MIAEELYKLLDSYIEKVANARDQVLFTEAVQAAKASALRAAYITLWLSCVESFKRRFQELAVNDFAAAEVVRKFEESDSKRLLVDEYLLEQAKRCGLVLAKDYGKLEQISAIQRIYSRPYEKQPKLQEFVADADAVVNAVLGQPTKIQVSQLFDQIHLLAREVDSLSTTLKQRSPAQQKSNLK